MAMLEWTDVTLLLYFMQSTELKLVKLANKSKERLHFAPQNVCFTVRIDFKVQHICYNSKKKKSV